MNVYYIPSGTKNLNNLFPELNFNEVKDYYVEVYNDATVIATTPVFNVGCCCDIRVIFYNYLGTYDGINFSAPNIIHENISKLFQKGLSYPLSETDTGLERYGISSNDTYDVINTCYTEKDKEWVQELLDSPKAFITTIGIEGLPDAYLPIIILDSKFEKQRNTFDYIIKLQFKLSNEFIIIRN